MATRGKTHEDYMREALAQAELGRGRTRPNPMVGCVIVKNGRIIAAGHHARAGLAHAEVVALAAAGERARGADAYVTLEPCSHVGRTGPCAQALIAAGVRRVFVGVRDPNPLVHGRGLRALTRAGIDVQVGVLGEPCLRLNEAFAHFIVAHRPYVIAKVAQSLDGRVATRTGASRWVSGEPARAFGHALRNACDGIMVGSGTVLADDPALTCRLDGGRDPLRIVVDTLARTPPLAKVVQAARRSAAPTLIATTSRASETRRRALVRAGAEVFVCRQRRGRVDLECLLDELGRRELLSVLVEGGPTLLGAMFDSHLVHKLHAFVAPLIIGGAEALSSVGGVGPALLRDAVQLGALELVPVGADLMVTAYPRYARAH